MRVSAHLRNLVYPGISPNDNHRSGLVLRMLRNAISTFSRPRKAPQVVRSTMSRDLGSRERHESSSAAAQENEGVGEHVRTRFHPGLKTNRALRPPVKLRIIGSAPNEENLFLLPDRFSKERALSEVRSSRLT